MKIHVSFTVDVNAEEWMLAYGLENKADVRADVQSHLTHLAVDGTASDASATLVERKLPNSVIDVTSPSGVKPTSENAAISGTVKGHVGDIERSYCLGCRREIPTESGHVCPSCATRK